MFTILENKFWKLKIVNDFEKNCSCIKYCYEIEQMFETQFFFMNLYKCFESSRFFHELQKSLLIHKKFADPKNVCEFLKKSTNFE